MCGSRRERENRKDIFMAVQTAEQLFMHELGDIYSTEQMILQMLPKMVQESNNQKTINAYNEHLRQTPQQVQNHQECFQILGQQPPRVTCYAIAGIKQEHDTFLNHNLRQR